MTDQAGRDDAAPATKRAAPPTTPRRPLHIVVALGLSASVYSFSLATVTRLQTTDDLDLVAERQPVEQAIALLRRTHDTLEARLDRAHLAYDQATSGYGSLSAAVADTHASLETLARIIADLEGIAADSPSQINLPSIQGGLGGSPAHPPKSHATTGASGAP